jgi:hypothetical protein
MTKGTNPDFSLWANFVRVLKIADKTDLWDKLWENLNPEMGFTRNDIEGMPSIVATELARIIEEGKK